MRKSLKIPLEFALIFLLAGSVSISADVKLRIYLQDGTLQAGNLVTETPETFVILSKEGRAEIKKDKIMFINGKTLKQWQDRPDKLFSTEIIPSDIPNPSYVNDKAALPPPPAVPKSAVPQAATPVVAPVKPLVEAQPKTPPAPPPANQTTAPVSSSAGASTKSSSPPAPSAPVAAQNSSSVAEPVKPAASSTAPAPVAKAPVPVVPVETKPRHSRRPKTPPATVIAEKPVVRPDVPAVSAANAIVAPQKFVRKDYGDYHYARAEAFLKEGERGRALQELHVATVLDRQNPESVLLLGKIYKEQGQFRKAAKYFAHPLLKKREEIKTFSAEIEKAEKGQKRSKWIFYGATAVGCLVWVPLLIMWRRMRREPKKVLTAETLAEAQTVVENVIEDIEKNDLAKEVKVPVTPPPAFMPPPVAPAPIASAPVAPARVAAPPPAAAPMPPAPAPVPPPPPPVPAIPLPFEPAFVLKPTPAPMLPSTAYPEILEPVPMAAAPVPPPVEGLTVEAVLQVAGMVERSVRKGNALAVEEKFDLARREYRTALVLNPACVEAFLGIGYLCFAQGMFDLALEHYRKALEIDPNSADGHYGIGRVLLETDQVNEAVGEFQKTLTLDPSFDDARETLTALGSLA